MFRMLFFTFLLVGCELFLPRVVVTHPKDIRPDNFYEGIKGKDPNRKTVLDDSIKTYESPICEKSESCVEICNTLFRNRENKKECSSLTRVQVEKFHDVFKILQQPGISDLKRLNLYDLKVFLNVSPEGAERAIRRVGARHAKSLLRWVAEDYKVATLFDEEDGDYVILETILDELKRDPIEALQVNIYAGHTPHELALEERNNAAFRWFHGIIEEECSANRGRYDEKENWCVLGHYCSIVKGDFNDDSRAAILGVPEVSSIVEEVMQNPPSRASRYFRSLGNDINNVTDIYQDICLRFCAAQEVDEC